LIFEPDATVSNAAPIGTPRSLADWLGYAETLHAQAIDMGLERVQRVRDSLALAPRFVVITVAGTNGKGSTCALLASVLRAAGYRVGVYTSPHLVRFNERVAVNGKPVDDTTLCAGFARVDAARRGTALTQFEFGTLAAMCVFDAATLDVVVLEVGLGGRLDAVNVFDADVAIITSIGIDHVEYLGPTRELIAREKAGVFRAGRPAVSGDADPPGTIAEEAARIGARLLQSGRDYRVLAQGSQGSHWALQLPARELAGLPGPALAGAFQVGNAAAALVALDAISARLPVSDAAMREGLATVALPGRFQRWRRHAAAPEVLLDVAHNPHAAERLAINLAAHREAARGNGRCIAVFAMLHDKDIVNTALALAPHVDAWHVAGIAERRGASAAEMAAALDAAGIRAPVSSHASAVEAFHAACAGANVDDRVLVCGSFVTVGAVLAEIEGIEASPG